MVGPWQVPVADAAVTLADFINNCGEAMAVGERTPLAILDAPAAGRMAVSEALMNLAGVPVEAISDIKLSANWMAASGEPGQDAALFDAVRAVGMELCPALGIAIPVGKDSLSMKSTWHDGEQEHRMLAPLSLIVSAFTPVTDVEKVITPQLQLDKGETVLLLVEPSAGRNRLGGSIYQQVYGQLEGATADIDEPGALAASFQLAQLLNRENLLLACHDRSDGGLLTTLCEMSFASRCGLDIELEGPAGQIEAQLFCEEPGLVMQVHVARLEQVQLHIDAAGLNRNVIRLGSPASHDEIRISVDGQTLYRNDRSALHTAWAETSWSIQRLRDNPECADEEYRRIADDRLCKLEPRLAVTGGDEMAAPAINGGAKPAVAIVREQGVNGQVEMAAAFHQAGFAAHDVHMSDLITGRKRLDDYSGIVACGGFSYGDVLGAGRGWAKSILFNDQLRQQFSTFLAAGDRFALGVCNGCQMLAALREIIPGTVGWPDFVRNRSEQFEARLSLVEIEASPSLFFTGMEGARLPVASAHGEGRAEFAAGVIPEHQVCLRYIEADGSAAEIYPANPNGSPQGATGLCNADGRVTILMPHPERTLRTVNFSWAPESWSGASPWLQMFLNARRWVT
jgi:phosphoribosylformylglycinamidine synthase